MLGIFCISSNLLFSKNDNLSLLSIALQNLTKKLSGLQRQLEATQKGIPVAKARVQKINENKYKIGNTNIHIVDQNIVNMNVDAIVNAANKDLRKNPGGVAGAIWQAAGKNKLNEWIEKNIAKPKNLIPGRDVLIPTGEAKWTPSFNLKNIKGIIQAVGPNCRAGENINLLYNTYKNSILLANNKGYKSIAFPAISIKIFKCDKVKCAELAVKALVETLPQTAITDVYLITYQELQGNYANALRENIKK